MILIDVQINIEGNQIKKINGIKITYHFAESERLTR